MNKPLMPMATAVWLIDNTSLSFRQIANFCGLHELEVQAIADETIGVNIIGIDPTLNDQLTWDEIRRCQDDPIADLAITVDEVPAQARTKGPRYTPVSKRQDKPDAIAWLVRHHGELTDGQIGKLIGTTKPTIQAIRDRSHWNMPNITPNDPVCLGLCSQIELDEAVSKAAKRTGTDESANAEAEEEDTSYHAKLTPLETTKSEEPNIEDVFGPAKDNN